MTDKKNTKRKSAWHIAACLLMLLLLILFLGKTIRTYSDSLYQNIRESTTQSVEALTADRVKMLDKTLTLLEIQAQTLAVQLSAQEQNVTSEMLRTFADMDENFLHVAVFNADGAGVSSDGALMKLSPDDEAYRQVFAGNSGITDTFTGAMGYEEVRVYAPIRQDGTITGGVYIDLAAEVLRSAGKGPLYDSAGYSYVLKQDGTILLAPASYSYAQVYHNVRDVFLFSESSQETVDAFMAALEEGKSGNAVLDFSGETQIICFEPSAVKQGWYYVSVLPLALVENNGQTVVRLSSQMVVLFILVILAFVVFLGAVLFFSQQDKWKQEINEGRVYKAISENINTAIFIMDQQTRYIRHAFENMNSILGLPAEQVQGCIFSPEWLAQTGLPAAVAHMAERAEKTSESVSEEVKHFNRRLGREVWLNVSISPLNLKGRKEYMVAFTDVTENKKLMEQLRESMLEAQSASAAKSSFLANMSHDIRTPMNAITGMTDIAIRSIGDSERVMDCLQKIGLSSRHLKRLINDILDMSKIESGKLSLNPGVTSLPEVMESLINIVQFQAAEKDQQLQVVIRHVEHETVLCDSVRLNQVLLNILANAVKFTPNGGSIRCSLEETVSPQGKGYRRYLFSVRDTGVGMSKDFQSMIFETFTREKSVHIEETEGSGLGMSISKWIVDQMGGTIQVFSEPGQGSEFLVTVDFPVPDESNGCCAVPSGLSLLLIDSDEQLRESTEFTFRELGFQVQAVPDVEKGLAHITGHRFNGQEYDMILLNGSRLDEAFLASVGRIRAAAEHAVIAVAAGDVSRSGEQILANGADGVISPLFFKSTLSDSLSRLLSHKTDETRQLPQDRPLEGCRVLLAEDNEINREIAVEILSSSGAVVDAADDGQKCLERFMESAPGYYQMILMDIRMPVMNGYDAARCIRASGHADAGTIPILAVTADAFSEDIQAAKAAGMDGHISKPLDMAQLISEMKRRL